MKYTKTAVAVAVAGGFAVAPMMAAAETTLSGLVQIKLTGVESDDDELQQDANFAASDVRVGVLSEHELNSGLIGYGNLQMNLDDLTGQGGPTLAGTDVNPSLSDEDLLDASATVAADNVYVGVKGGFGDVRIGEIPLAIEYPQVANDIHDVSGDVGDGISYTGTFGPVGLVLNASPEPDVDMIGAGVKFGLAGFSIGLGFESRADDEAPDEDIETFGVGASYAIAGFSIAAHYWTKGNLDVDIDDGDDDDDTTSATIVNDLDDQTNLAAQVGYSIAGVSLGLTYSLLTTELDEDGDVGEDEETIIRFDAGYDLGGGMDVSTRIQNKSTEAGVGADPDDELEYRVQLSKTF